ncbi:MAG: hypothetical protein JNL38_17915 [Myxococcales bacterium]|jgi:DNA-binding CsgD family transcriptional regulator|nr:hypothetical protein [Myxococcales bacterium]
MARFDPVALLEATARWEADPQAWLQGIAESTRALDLGCGRVVYTLTFHRGRRPSLVAAEDGAPGWPAELERLNAVFSPAATALVHVPIGRVRSHGARIVQENAARTGMTFDEYMRIAGPGASGPPLADFAHGGSGRDRASFVALADRPRSLSPARKRVLEHFLAHFASMARLRRRLGQTPADRGADAVLDGQGKLLHAERRAEGARETLVDAVLRSERARGPLRRQDPETATATWRALVAGEYTLVESVERDGKRLLLARKNAPDARALTALNTTEAACAYFTALGHPQKLIAYELGISPSAAARSTRAAVAKLRLRTPEELVRVIGPLLQDPARG